VNKPLVAIANILLILGGFFKTSISLPMLKGYCLSTLSVRPPRYVTMVTLKKYSVPCGNAASN